MRIAASAIDMQSRHTSAWVRTEQETLRTWRRQRGSDSPPDTPQASAQTRISEAAQALAAQLRNTAESTQRTNESELVKAIGDDPADSDPMLSLIRAVVELLTGETVQTVSAQHLAGNTPETPPPPSEPPRASSPPGAGPRRAGWGMEYHHRSVREEYERTDLSANGVVVTADGARIDFKLDLTMERYFRQETSTHLRAGDAVRKDPLVINFAGSAAQLSNQRFRFDLDVDGVAEDIPLLAGGSGYLSLDLNGNGRIDDGRELFGPASGSGFGELANLDSDGNGWLDENDPAFARLRIWQPETNGPGQLTSLLGQGVGALYLGHAQTPFELRGDGNTDLGAVRASGLFLFESGKAGTMQEIDLTI